MFSKLLKWCNGFKLGCLSFMLLVTLIAALSWIATCGLIYLITLCFGWTFNWAIATGIWLVLLIARTVFSNNTTVKK